MRYSTRLSDALHILMLIQFSGANALTSKAIANSVYTNPSYVRTLMAKMKAAGLITSSQGSAGALLARPAEEISMLDVYRALEGNKRLLHLDTHVNPQCESGVFIQLAVQNAYNDIQNVLEGKMAAISLASLSQMFQRQVKDALEDAPTIEDAVASAIARLQAAEQAGASPTHVIP